MKRNNTVRILVILALAALCLAFTARAQEPVPPMERAPVWMNNIGDQLAQALASPSPAIRNEALQHIAYFAYFYKDRLDLTDVLPNLLSIYKEAPDEEGRLLALAAIHATGSEDAMQEVRRYSSIALDEESSLRVRLVTLAALMQFYGEDTFDEDKEVARIAKSLLDYYTSPRVIVEPPVILEYQ